MKTEREADLIPFWSAGDGRSLLCRSEWLLVWTTWDWYVECGVGRRDVQVAGRERCKHRLGPRARLRFALYAVINFA